MMQGNLQLKSFILTWPNFRVRPIQIIIQYKVGTVPGSGS